MPEEVSTVAYPPNVLPTLLGVNPDPKVKVTVPERFALTVEAVEDDRVVSPDLASQATTTEALREPTAAPAASATTASAGNWRTVVRIRLSMMFLVLLGYRTQVGFEFLERTASPTGNGTDE